MHAYTIPFYTDFPLLQGMEKLVSLKDLNLSSNQIREINSSLDQLCQLEVLNLSGNKISSLDVSLQK